MASMRRVETEFVRELRERGLFAMAHAICLSLGVTVDELGEDCRLGPVIEARRRLSLYLHDELKWSYPMMGRLLRKDHSTVHALINGRRGGGTKVVRAVREESQGKR
jgi:hypothetical protein